VVHGDVDADHLAKLVMIGDHGNGPLCGLQHLEPQRGVVWQQRPVPAARTKAEMGVNAIRGALSGRIGPCAERL